MNKPHDLIWKFWASEQMACNIYKCSIDLFPKEHVIALAQILKKEWLR